MPDYGHDLLFGVFVPPLAEQHDQVRALVRHADAVGLDLVGIQDHPYQPRFLDAWTLLATLARETERIRLLPDVANVPLRLPAVLARSAATLDILSGGRVELGLGAGAFWDRIEAMGGPRRTRGESVEALEEAIAIIRGLWTSEGPVRVEGRHYAVHGAEPGPRPPHRIGIWLGVYGPRMLRVCGRLADGWIPSAGYLPLEELPARSRILDQAAERAGRDPAEIRRAFNVNGDFDGGDGLLQGPPAAWAETLTGLVLEHGLSAFLLTAQPGATALVSRFAEEVAPAVREAVARERRRPFSPST